MLDIDDLVFACMFNCYTEIRYSAKSYHLGTSYLTYKDKCVTISMNGAQSSLRALLSVCQLTAAPHQFRHSIYTGNLP